MNNMKKDEKDEFGMNDGDWDLFEDHLNAKNRWRELERVTYQFNRFIESIDATTEFLIRLNDNRLTDHISIINYELWKLYKEINGTSAGTYGISEYIVFSTFKNYIEKLNKPLKFYPKRINKDLYFFELKKKEKVLNLTRSSKLDHIGLKSTRRPDIALVKEEGGILQIIAIIEIKNYLDKRSANSALNILSEIEKDLNDTKTKYVIFSFNKISVEDKEELKMFSEKENCFLITYEKNNNKEIKDRINLVDLSELFDSIKDSLIL